MMQEQHIICSNDTLWTDNIMRSDVVATHNETLHCCNIIQSEVTLR